MEEKQSRKEKRKGKEVVEEGGREGDERQQEIPIEWRARGRRGRFAYACLSMCIYCTAVREGQATEGGRQGRGGRQADSGGSNERKKRGKISGRVLCIAQRDIASSLFFLPSAVSFCF